MSSTTIKPFYKTYKDDIHFSVGVILGLIGIGITLVIALLGGIITTYSYIKTKKRLTVIESRTKNIPGCPCPPNMPSPSN